MKTSLLTLILLFTLNFSFAQLQSLNANITNDLTGNSVISQIQTRTHQCGPDTAQYPLAKSTGLQAISINNATSAPAVSQYFDAPQAITISGAEFYAYKTDATGGITIPITISVYLAGADSLPTGTALATQVLTIDTAFGTGTLSELRKVVTFSPIVVNQAYCVVYENNSAINTAIIFNDYTSGDGLTEWLCSVSLGGNWLHGYEINVGGALLDADLLMHPIVEYDLDASFIANPSCMINGGLMTLTNASSPIINNRMYNQAAFIGNSALSYTYDFGDASPTVNAINTTHTYAAGIYTMTLSDTIFGWTTNCAADTSFNTAYDITANFSNTVAGLGAGFTDLSISDDGIVTSWIWDFGDGNTSTQQNPNHSYTAPGTYTVCLIATNICTADTVCMPITLTCNNPVSAFGASSAGLTASFTDMSTTSNTISSWVWDFGDGNTSTLQNPNHTYAIGGVYTVCLTVSDACGTDSSCQAVTVVCNNPIPDFSASSSGLMANFTDLSTSSNAITSWFWDFGDGSTSTVQNGSNAYAAPGIYTVCLTVTDACGTDSSCQQITISCSNPIASFGASSVNLNASFTDLSSSSTGVSSWMWDFGDGNTSTMQNPNHSYLIDGVYTVCLTVSDSCGSDSSCQAVTVIATDIKGQNSQILNIYPNPTSDILFISNSSANEMKISLLDVNGRLIMQQTAYNKTQLSLAPYANGVYVLRVATDSQLYESKIVKH